MRTGLGCCQQTSGGRGRSRVCSSPARRCKGCTERPLIALVGSVVTSKFVASLPHAPWVHWSCPAAMDSSRNAAIACVSLLLCPGLSPVQLGCRQAPPGNTGERMPPGQPSAVGYANQCPSFSASKSSAHSILQRGPEGSISVAHTGDLLINCTSFPVALHISPQTLIPILTF